MNRFLPILVAVVLGITRNRAKLLSVAAQHLWVEGIFSATAVSQRLHDRIDFLFEHLRELDDKRME